MTKSGLTQVSDQELLTVTGDRIRIPDPHLLVHLQFRRFAGCPICNLHLQSVVRRHDEIRAAGIVEVVFFQSPADELRKHTVDLPFATIPDPDKRYYKEFGVESSPRAVLDPRAWRTIVQGIATTMAGRFRTPALKPHGGRLGLPADFLIDTEGVVVATKFGQHADDQWSVDELLAHANRAAPSRTYPPE